MRERGGGTEAARQAPPHVVFRARGCAIGGGARDRGAGAGGGQVRHRPGQRARERRGASATSLTKLEVDGVTGNTRKFRGERCFRRCKRNGACEHCGTDLCCRKGWDANESRSGEGPAESGCGGLGGEGKHVCTRVPAIDANATARESFAEVRPTLSNLGSSWLVSRSEQAERRLDSSTLGYLVQARPAFAPDWRVDCFADQSRHFFRRLLPTSCFCRPRPPSRRPSPSHMSPPTSASPSTPPSAGVAALPPRSLRTRRRRGEASAGRARRSAGPPQTAAKARVGG